MNAKLGQHMTLLGLCSMAFYGLMLGTGNLSLEVMPQFVVSAIIFLSSGRIMRKAARAMARDEVEEDEKAARAKVEPDWEWLTALMNWTAAMLVIGIMAILLLKPIGLSWQEAFSFTKAHELYYSGVVP